MVLAGLADAQQDQVLLDAFLRGHTPEDVAQHSECFDRVLGVVVVPWYPVVAEKREQFVPILLKTILELERRFGQKVASQ